MSCNICYANLMGINSIEARPATLCTTHFFEWQEEKIYNDLDMSTEGIYF
jgi:hypothetical protein